MTDRLPKLILDPANEGDLTQLAYNRIRTASGNLITDFRPGSSIAAFVEGQTFALMELLYYVNLLPEALAIEVFSLFDVARNIGTPARGELVFRLTNTSSSNFVLPAGYTVPYLDALVVLDTSLVIPAGAQEAGVLCTVDRVGEIYNAAAFDITIGGSIGAISNIYNRTAFTGGSDPEPLESLVARCQQATSYRNAIVTVQDYVTACSLILGSNSKTVVVPNLAPDGLSYRFGSVGLFILDGTGRPASAATCQNVVSSLSSRIQIGTSVSAFPAVLVPIEVTAIINTVNLSDTIANNAIAAIKRYLTPKNWDGGNVVLHNEVAYRVRQIDGVRSVDSILFNNSPIDYLKAQPYHYVVPSVITIIQADTDGVPLTTTAFYDVVDYISI